MAFSVSPSVIVREVDASAAVPAIATPPAAMAGVFRWGPVGETVLVSSENELVDRFGKPDDDNYETFFVAADYLSYANALWVVRADNGAVKARGAEDIVLFDANTAPDANTDIGKVDEANTTFGAFEGLYPGALANSVDVVYVDSDNFVLEVMGQGTARDSLTFTQVPNTSIQNSFTDSFEYGDSGVSILVADTDRLTGVNVGDVLRIGNDSVGYQDMVVTSWAENPLDQYGLDETDVQLISWYRYDVTFASNYSLFQPSLSELEIEKRWEYANTFAVKPSAGNYHIAVVDRTGNITGEAGTVVESYLDVSTVPTAKLPDGRTNYYADMIEQRSAWVAVANTDHFEATTVGKEQMILGTDGLTETTATLASLAAGYDLFANANEIDVSFILQGKGDQAATRANYIISNVADSRKDAIAFLSPSKADVVDENKTNAILSNVLAYRNRLQNSSYWFMDSGYKYRYDKYNDVYRWVPLNGDMAGLASRVEPFESPAGFRKGVIKNVIKLAFNPNKAQRDQLYGSDVNPVMSQVGQGVVLFGDKTGLGLASAFDRINVRRLFIAVEKAIANAAQSFLFELNDEFTQTQFKNIVEPFLREIQGRRGIIDFRVISDTTVNTPTIIDQGKFRANIFIKPARSINIIELTFVATRTGIEFEEIVGSLT